MEREQLEASDRPKTDRWNAHGWTVDLAGKQDARWTKEI